MRTPRGVAAALLAITFALLPAASSPAADLLPDLVAEAPDYPQPLEVARLPDGRDQLRVRFDGWIHNIGAGAFEIRGSLPVNGNMTVTAQRIYGTGGTFRDETGRHPQLHYEDTDGHNHWHLKSAARYSLWNEAGTAQAAPAAKVGFCLLDSEHVDSFGPARVYARSATQYCRENQANAASVYQGISSGWRDYYPFDLPFQWVDVSDVAPGRYRLAADVDPDNFVVESNEANNGPALGPPSVTVPGYTAAPVTVAGVQQVITLPAQPYGAPGAPLFRIEAPPGHGSLGAANPGQVLYTPNRGFVGTDSFVYSVRDSASAFPLHASAAAVTVKVPSAAARQRLRLLTGLRWRRHGRSLRLRARARRTGVLRIVVRKGKRRQASCRHRARAGRRFACRMRLRRHPSLKRARARVTLLVAGKAGQVDTYRVPRRLRSR